MPTSHNGNRSTGNLPFAVSRPEAAALLDISMSTFDEWVRRGWMPRGIKIGALRRWDTGDVLSSWRKLVELQRGGEEEDDGENPFDHTVG
jgi:predicted DNA-binding transcriptional regulator AlpA